MFKKIIVGLVMVGSLFLFSGCFSASISLGDSHPKQYNEYRPVGYYYPVTPTGYYP